MGWFGVIGGALGIIAYAIKWDAYLNQLAVQKISPEGGLAMCGKWCAFYVHSRTKKISNRAVESTYDKLVTE